MLKHPPLSSDSAKAILEDLVHRPVVHPLALLGVKDEKFPPDVLAHDIQRGVILYGAGHLGEIALAFLKHVGVSVSFVIDRNAKAILYLGEETPVQTLDTVPPNADQVVLVTTVNAPYSIIANDIIAHGWQRVMPFYDFAWAFKDQHPLNNGWYAGQLNQDDRDGIAAVLEEFDDNHSKAAYLQFLAWRLIREDWVFEGGPMAPLNTRYFIEPVRMAMTKNEEFIDGGAYDGRIIKRFLEITENCLASAHLYEADESNFSLLESALAETPQEVRSKLHIFTTALSDTSGELPFIQNFGMASRLSDYPTTSVPTRRLDDLNLNPSFVKLHLEGAEFRALIGGMQTLIRNRPILAVTAYHSREGLWLLPRLLMNNLKNYRFYFRLDAWCGTGALIYGIPLERNSATMDFS